MLPPHRAYGCFLAFRKSHCCHATILVTGKMTLISSLNSFLLPSVDNDSTKLENKAININTISTNFSLKTKQNCCAVLWLYPQRGAGTSSTAQLNRDM